MKVVMLSRVAAPYHGYGGMQKYIFSLSEHLVEKNVRVEIVLSTADQNSEIMRREHAGISYTFVPPVISEGLFPFWYSYHLFSKRASDYLAELDFDLLHAYGFPAFFYLLRGRRKPVVIQPFGSESFKTKSLEKLANYVMWYGQSRYSMHKAEAIASEGKAQSNEIASIYGVSGEKIFLLPDGVDIKKIREYVRTSELKREDLGLREDDLVIANVNRLEENKGVLYLVRALSEIKRAVGQVKLIMIGSGSHEASLKSQIDSLGLSDSVIHFKEVEESRLFGYLKLADMSVTPTLFEGLPIVLLEAMACGLPVVTTNISDNSELVRNGENGYLVTPADSRAISEAVIKIWRGKDLKRMGERSLEMVEGYDWPRVAEAAIAQYEKMVYRGRKSRS